MNKKKILNVLLEILYLLSIFAYLLIVKYIYSNNISYDFEVFMAFSLVIIGIALLVGSHINKYSSFILCTIYTLYLVAQKTYYNGFGSYFRFSTALELGKEVAEQKGAIGELFDTNDLIPFIVLIAITVVFLVLRYAFKAKTKYRWYVRLSSLLCFLLSFVFINTMTDEIIKTGEGDDMNFLIYKTDFYVYDTVNNPEAFVKKLGLLTYGYRDTVSLFESKKVNDLYDEELSAYYNSLSDLNETNDYTGLFKDKSLIIIQAESLNNWGISEELTPTLYKMMSKGMHFTNFNTPLLIGSTSDSEFMANTSFIPEAEGYSVCYQFVDNTYPLTLGNLFKDNGYKTDAYHNNFREYYNRDITFANYGYKFFDSYELGVESETQDSLLSEQIAYIDVEKEKFMSFWVSYSGHQTYSLDGVGVDSDDVAKIKEIYPNLNDEYVSYIAKTMDLDKAVEKILNIFEWNDRLDDVAILIYGDHIAKSLDFSDSSNLRQVFGDDEKLLYTPMFIYTSDMEAVTVDKYCTALDILPTLMNLWDFDYESKYAFGNDILDNSYRGFAFDANGNCWNNDFYYNSTDVTITTYNGYNEDDAWDIVNDFNKKREICKKTLIVDYFKKAEE